MNKNIFKVLLLILLAISFVKPAKASIKPLEINSNDAYVCYYWIDDPDDEEEGSFVATGEKIVYGIAGINDYINNLPNNVEFGCDPYL